MKKKVFIQKIRSWHIALLLSIFSFLYFYKDVLLGLYPIPSDALVGLYHPFRDFFASTYPNGIPFKNFLLTDPIRQIIPWKDLSTTLLSQGSLPLWNPYEMGGKPLLGNFQSSPFYPFNLLLGLLSFEKSWSLFIMLQQFLGFIFMFIYLKNKKIDKTISVIGAFTFVFSGFVIAWLEWGTIIHTFIWLPLVLYSIDKMSEDKCSKKIYALYVISLSSSLFAGHLQTFIYIFAISLAYFGIQSTNLKQKIRLHKIKIFVFLNLIFIALTSIQWYPTLQFIFESARDSDQSFLKEGFFLPPQHLVQFFAPDFFGNPATLNYFGVWNYAEFLGYIGLIPLIFALLTVGILRREIIFFQAVFIFSLIFSLSTPFLSWIYSLNIPLFSSTQPTRLLSLITFSLVILACYGLHMTINSKLTKKRLFGSLFALIVISSLWTTVIFNPFGIEVQNISITKRNILLPTALVACGMLLLFLLQWGRKKRYVASLLLISILFVTAFDLIRVADKFTPFSPTTYFYPNTKTIAFLKADTSQYRIATTDSRILAPNIPTYYRIESIEGYDPLYLNNYAKFIILNERSKPDLSTPYGFNRIITPRNLETPLIDFLNTKYILALSDISNDSWKKVFQEGETRVYENSNVLPRAFFVDELIKANNDLEAAELLLQSDLKTQAITTDNVGKNNFASGSAQITTYSENKVVLTTQNNEEGFLVISDTHYPTWKVKINGKEDVIYRVNLAFRGIIVPPGENEIIFYNTLF